jgi:hypothetical protein
MADSIALVTDKTCEFFDVGIQKNGGGLLTGAIYEAIADAENVASIGTVAANAYGTFDIAATGVSIGDHCFGTAANGGLLNVAGVFFQATVTAANVITVSILNMTNAAIDALAADYRVLVIPR